MGRRGTSRRPPAFASTAYGGDRVASASATGMDAGALLRELRGRVDRAENTHMGTHGVAKTGKSIGAAAKKSRRHLEGMKASKAQTPVGDVYVVG